METDYQKKYEHLVSRVKTMLDTQQEYFKSRDRDVLKKSKAIEAEVREILNPKPKQTMQTELDWLGQ